jgi:hypothetical protein
MPLNYLCLDELADGLQLRVIKELTAKIVSRKGLALRLVTEKIVPRGEEKAQAKSELVSGSGDRAIGTAGQQKHCRGGRRGFAEGAEESKNAKDAKENWLERRQRLNHGGHGGTQGRPGPPPRWRRYKQDGVVAYKTAAPLEQFQC